MNPTNNPLSIFEDGKLKPEIYKIQNLYSQTFLDLREFARALLSTHHNSYGWKGP